jgi:hypothetical protein
MEVKLEQCAYCGKSLNGEVRYHHAGFLFCNEQEATLHDYADIFAVQKPSTETLKTPHLPYVPDMGVRRKHD